LGETVASPARTKSVFTFGLFEADPESGELLRRGQRTRLQDQPFRMLILLLERPGEVISREELRERLWPQNTFVEFDNGLNVAVKKIRKALSDHPENPRFIETIPKRGYRFIAPVSIKATGGEAGPQALQPIQLPPDSNAGKPEPPTQLRRWRKYAFAGAGLLVVLAATAVVMTRIPSRKKPPQAPSSAPSGPAVPARRIVAVMEFQNASGHAGDEWLSTAISEMLATELGAGEKLHLVPADDVARMKRELGVTNSGGMARDTAINAGKNLQADMLVGGSFTMIGSGRDRRLRVDVHMQELSQGEIVAEVAETGDVQHLFELVDRAGTRLREAIGVPGPSPLEESAARAALPSNPVASRLYAEGLTHLRVADAAGARDLLEQAVAAEPAFPLSHMALASTWRALGYEQKAKSEAKKALDLSSQLSRADQLLIEGRYYQLSGDMERAISAYRALFTLFPDSVEDGLMLAESQTWGGKAADAMATVESLRRLPPPISQDPRIDMQQARVLSALDREGGLGYLRQAEAKARTQGAPLLAAKAQIGECIRLNAAAQFEDGARACQAAYSIFVAAGNPTDTAQSLRHLGDSRQSQGKLDEALGLYQQALKINQSVGDNTGVAISINQMAILYETRGDLSQAEKFYRQSYALFLKVGHRVNAAILAGNVAGILIQRGKLSEAEPVISKSMNLARESGSKNTQAQAYKLMADLSLLRGDFEHARQHIESAQALEPQDNNVVRYDALTRMSRILAAQDNLSGARRNRVEALALAEKIDAKGLTAQARLALAELDLEQEHAGEAEQQIRDALAVFRSEKMRDDEVQAQAALSRCLLMQGKNQEADAALAEGRTVAAYSQSPAVHLIFAIADARSKSAGTASLRSLARMQLLRSAQEAAKLGFMPTQYEAQLALDELEISENSPMANKSLESLARGAHEHGLELIARKAAALRQRQAE